MDIYTHPNVHKIGGSEFFGIVLAVILPANRRAGLSPRPIQRQTTIAFSNFSKNNRGEA